MSDADLMHAYLYARRQQSAVATHLSIPIVRTRTHAPRAYGPPCMWGPGVASAVLSNEWTLDSISFPVLQEPIENVRHAWEQENAMRCAVAFDKGVRRTMEDTYSIVTNFIAKEALTDAERASFQSCHFFGVFDGHMGSESAEFCRQRLHSIVAVHKLRHPDMEFTEVLREAFRDADALLLREMASLRNESGSAVACVVLEGRVLHLAHCGDCRVVLGRAGTAIDLTTDHRPDNPVEVKRISSIPGSSISYGRLNGHLAICRAFGGMDLDLIGTEQCKMIGLSSEPDISKFYITSEDEFIIIASDGLWDIMSSELAVQLVRNVLRSSNNVEQAVDQLVDRAMKRESEDNVTVVIIAFNRQNTATGRRAIIHSTPDAQQSWHRESDATRPRLSPYAIEKLNNELQQV